MRPDDPKRVAMFAGGCVASVMLVTCASAYASWLVQAGGLAQYASIPVFFGGIALATTIVVWAAKHAVE